MRIALISFEFPPSEIVGGIGTYAGQACQMLTSAGHDVEVFAGPSKNTADISNHFKSLIIHRFAVERKYFSQAIVESFSSRHSFAHFDVIESPELGCEGLHIHHRHPEIPLVVKLHTSSDILSEICYEPVSLSRKLRFLIGALRRFRLSWINDLKPILSSNSERLFTTSAHEISAPSFAIALRTIELWNIYPERISVFPLPFVPSQELLDLQIPSSVNTIGFVGRLETRKGIFELAKAVKPILAKYKYLSLHLIGPSWASSRGDSIVWLKRYLNSVLDQVKFVGRIEQSQLSDCLSKCDLIVLPSRWESFGLACAEAMASGRLVIASSAGGMGEMIQNDINGLLIQSNSPEQLKSVILRCIKEKDLVHKLGLAGRQRIISYLDPARILPMQLASYERAIQTAMSL